MEEIERQEVIDSKDFEKYHKNEWPWELDDISEFKFNHKLIERGTCDSISIIFSEKNLFDIFRHEHHWLYRTSTVIGEIPHRIVDAETGLQIRVFCVY